MSDWKSGIDRQSFALGMAAAFCECVSAECKKCAFSAPVHERDAEPLRLAMESIAKEHGLKSYFEASAEIPEANRLCWWVFYKYDLVLEEYLALRKRGLHPVADLNPFYGLLSYGAAFGKPLKKDGAVREVCDEVMLTDTGEDNKC